MQTLDEMRDRHLLTADQHFEVGAYIAEARTPHRIMEMPPHLWRALELASVLMNLDADLAPMAQLNGSGAQSPEMPARAPSPGFNNQISSG